MGKRRFFLVCALSMFATSVSAQIADQFCSFQEMKPSLRQTLLVIDGSVISPELEGEPAKAENNGWRDFVRQFVDARSPGISSRVAPRERVTVVIANADGAGASQVFSGCIPVFSAEEDAHMQEGDSSIGKFFGSSWSKRHEDMAKDVARAAQVGLLEGARNAQPTSNTTEVFSQSALVHSLRKGQSLDLTNGVPRILVYTDLSKFEFPQGDTIEMRRAGFADAERADLALGFAEMHLFTADAAVSSGAERYLEAFFLGSEADLVSQSRADSRFQPSAPIASVKVFNGVVDYGDGVELPVRLRLVEDYNGETVNSWIAELGRGGGYVPVKGQMSCTGSECNFAQSRNFGEVWNEDIDAKSPECGNHLPFFGMRFLKMELMSEKISGMFLDPICYLQGREDGVPFNMIEVANGRW